MNAVTSTLKRLWVADRSIADPMAEQRNQRTRFDALGNSIFWPFAFLLFMHRIFVLAVNGSITDDFSTVYYALRRFLEGQPIYNETYYFVDPHYLYSPGATLFLSPLGMLTDFDAARLVFIIANALGIVAAPAILTRLFGYSLQSAVWPASITFAFLTEAVRNTLVFSNINGLLLLALCGFLALLYHDRRWSAGLVLGVAILIKPIFAPLLFLPFVKANWQSFVGAISIPVVFNVVAWVNVPSSHDYVTRTIPYLGEIRDFSNSSLPGMAVYFGMPKWQEQVWFFVFAGFVIVGLLGLLRFRYSDPLLWLTSTSSLLLSGVFFLSSLGQMYYSMLLFPLIFTVLLRRSAMQSWVAWLATYCFLSPDDWRSEEWLNTGRWLSYLKPTIGWGLIIIVIAVSAALWALEDLRRGRRHAR